MHIKLYREIAVLFFRNEVGTVFIYSIETSCHSMATRMATCLYRGGGTVFIDSIETSCHSKRERMATRLYRVYENCTSLRVAIPK